MRDRTRLSVANAVSEKFSFLGEQGFSEVESLPTIVRYRKRDLEVHVYHGRRSFELGFEVGASASCMGRGPDGPRTDSCARVK
jgi:hypothetical protein